MIASVGDPESPNRSLQLRQHLEQIAHQSDVRDLEDRRVGVLVDGDDRARVLDAGQVLDRTADADGDISDRTVEDYYGGRIEATAFKVVDSAVAGRLGDALVTLRHALQSGADPVPIVATFAAKLRLMAKLYGERRGSGELAGALGAAPWQIDRARKDLSGWSETGLGNAIEVIAQTDANVKGASRDPIYALERMVNVVASYGRR